jgi:hypothetical protein
MLNDERDEHRPLPPQPSGFPSTITVNVVVSGQVTLMLDGHAVLEILSTASGTNPDLAKLTAELTASNTKLDTAVTTNPVP